MKRISLLLIVQFTGIVWGQLMTGSGSANGVSFSYETRLEPPDPPISKIGGGVLTHNNNIVKRHVCDFAQKKCFGYDLTMEPLADGRFRFEFSPLTITPEQMAEIFDNVGGWTLLPMPQHPAAQILQAGDTLALDLFVNPSTGQKIVDYLKIQGGHGRRLSASGPAHDFSVEAGWLEISAPRLTINGKLLEATALYRGGVGGSPLWIYISGRGRFIFSLAPRMDLGLQKAGEIRGSTLTWRWGGDEFSLNTDKRIAPGGGAYNVYVFNDSSYRPKGKDDNAAFLMGAGGALETLVRH
jgi:hypothetical protein